MSSSTRLDSISLDLKLDELEVRMQSEGACVSSSAKIESLSSKTSGMASNTIHALLTADASSV